MTPPLAGLHHVTATVDEAQADLDFCIGMLGLRLVKKTVNFDNHHVYHFYYGDERGTPGTIWTTFPYRGRGVPAGSAGAGQITTTAFSVPAETLDWWEQRLKERRWPVRGRRARFGEDAIVVHDSSGLVFELVASGTDGRSPWTRNGVGAPQAIRGIHSVALAIASPPATIAFMTGRLGFSVIAEGDRWTRLAVGGDLPGHLVDIHHVPEAPRARNGIGTVHHVAFAIADGDLQLEIREELLRAGIHVTEVRDRQYFTSIYFREPGGVLFEIATMGPGFGLDETLPDLGQALKLPPWEEPFRLEIERGLAAVSHR